MPIVTISASYGAGGSEVGPALARRLDVRFVDRVFASAVAEQAADAQSEGRFMRLLRSVSPAAGFTAASIEAQRHAHDRSAYREVMERGLHEAVAGGDAVVLGRAAACALRDQAQALHVRLDGPVERRVTQAMRIEDVDEATARHRLRVTDDARERYVRELYGVDPADPALYAMVLDGTALEPAGCVEVIAAALLARVA